jgi:hypothetical protein
MGGRGDKETRRQGDKETRRQGDKETRRQGDKETRRQGDKETRRQGDGRFDWCVPLLALHGLWRALGSKAHDALRLDLVVTNLEHPDRIAVQYNTSLSEFSKRGPIKKTPVIDACVCG